MAIAKIPEEMPALSARGNLGRPDGLGSFMLGWSELGTYNITSGCYKRNGRWGNSKIVRYRHYWPKNTITPKRTEVRNKLANAVQAWHDLSESEKQEWRKKTYPPNMYGYARFIRAYMLDQI